MRYSAHKFRARVLLYKIVSYAPPVTSMAELRNPFPRKSQVIKYYPPFGNISPWRPSVETLVQRLLFQTGSILALTLIIIENILHPRRESFKNYIKC